MGGQGRAGPGEEGAKPSNQLENYNIITIIARYKLVYLIDIYYLCCSNIVK